jgi:hypothetical protein
LSVHDFEVDHVRPAAFDLRDLCGVDAEIRGEDRRGNQNGHESII